MALPLATDPWAIRVRAEQARMAAERAAFVPRSSPALDTGIAEMEGHARRWSAARRETLAQVGCTDAPAQDRYPNLRIAA